VVQKQPIATRTSAEAWSAALAQTGEERNG
jgi:hypothetical protein